MTRLLLWFLKLGRMATLGIAIAGLTGVASAEETSGAEQAPCIPRAECCKVCSNGKACGNTCISRSYACHKGAGCACDSENVCE